MTYKLNPEVRRILSPVCITWNGTSGNREDRLEQTAPAQQWHFASGADAAEAVFDRHFNILSYRASGDTVDIVVYEFMEPAGR